MCFFVVLIGFLLYVVFFLIFDAHSQLELVFLNQYSFRLQYSWTHTRTRELLTQEIENEQRQKERAENIISPRSCFKKI